MSERRKNVTPNNAKRVLDLETNIIYSSLEEAAKLFKNPNTARRAISKVCKGLRKHFKNKVFKFLD